MQHSFGIVVHNLRARQSRWLELVLLAVIAALVVNIYVSAFAAPAPASPASASSALDALKDHSLESRDAIAALREADGKAAAAYTPESELTLARQRYEILKYRLLEWDEAAAVVVPPANDVLSVEWHNQRQEDAIAAKHEAEVRVAAIQHQEELKDRWLERGGPTVASTDQPQEPFQDPWLERHWAQSAAVVAAQHPEESYPAGFEQINAAAGAVTVDGVTCDPQCMTLLRQQMHDLAQESREGGR